MNGLFAWAYGRDDIDLPKFSWSVFHAFDEGEYKHGGEPENSGPEYYTVPMLKAALEERRAYMQMNTDSSTAGYPIR